MRGSDGFDARVILDVVYDCPRRPTVFPFPLPKMSWVVGAEKSYVGAACSAGVATADYSVFFLHSHPRHPPPLPPLLAVAGTAFADTAPTETRASTGGADPARACSATWSAARSPAPAASAPRSTSRVRCGSCGSSTLPRLGTPPPPPPPLSPPLLLRSRGFREPLPRPPLRSLSPLLRRRPLRWWWTPGATR